MVTLGTGNLLLSDPTTEWHSKPLDMLKHRPKIDVMGGRWNIYSVYPNFAQVGYISMEIDIKSLH